MDKLNLSDERFYQIFMASPFPITVSRLADGCLLDVNQAFVEASGYTYEQLVGKSAFELESWVFLEERQRIRTLLEQHGEVVRFPISMRDGHNQPRSLLLSARLLELFDEPCMLAMFYDVTEFKNTESRLLEQNQELETFVYRTSHNLKGPVASLKGLLQLAALELTDEPAQRYLGLLNNLTQHLEAALNELIDLTRLKRGQVRMEPINLREIIHHIVAKLKFQPIWTQVDLKIELESEMIYSDYDMMNSVMQNLIENAVKYRAADRPLQLRITSSRTPHLTLCVKDNGEGMSDEVLHKVFEMFYRASGKTQGTGLGLYIVQNTVEKLGGSISVESQLNVGTTFTLTLPQPPEQAAS
ncbi:PAS domain S-box-containing protein [Catalinimonas alkaloidigena]|uniref:histidine kinase n=1 Tax=Catalinimonas alkaloidigena TaxID=1075417 RepID=A0A1G9S5D9_9BACT|nr:PAS domain-containing sensor histidine kinase [Catalinimonas alkaloidigena]SDM30611.1 PAS domain S-box-containing protein [Catalinimonas alkaloidigena]